MLWTALLLLPGPAVAQSHDTTGFQVGSRVRVKQAGPDQRWLTGKLLALPSDTVRLATGETGSDSVALALNSLAGFDRSQGQRSRTGKGALIGLGTGAALGFILGVVTYEECTGFCILDLDRTENGLLGGLTGALLGTVGGAVIGASVRSDRWAPVQQPWGADTTRR